ncbi:MAG TPA: cupin-like domain-containing protein [Polyangia bacterium]|nr:cupin-like domain-containing protein [Polyangia bacterium]
MTAIDVDATFDQFKIARLRHHLVGHPLMTPESLAELALRIDPEYVRFHEGERGIATRMSQMLSTDPTREALRRTIDNLGKRSAFVQIINIYSDPAYRALLDEVFEQVTPFLPARDRNLINRDAAAFLASPQSVTPFHLDHEQNFLCHMGGQKTFYVWDHRDRSVVSEQELEIFYGAGKLREQIYRPEMQQRAHAFELQPGDCIFMPMGSPHAASTGSDVTVTFSILFNTESAFDMVETYRANHAIRRLGLSPTPVGASALGDSLKRRTLGAVRRVRNLARGRRTERRLNWY